ncbi:MAG: carboxypeptidase regulatory-like domain-containing protein, partial [Candidatus Omnitrophica bacterium]|nr:carboxypeptidase regulatory-like domain-containing protein [Candidatus Omnitrophota bacterium]
MKKLVCVLLFLAAISFGDTVTGIILTTDRKPVSDAEVSILKPAQQQTVIKKTTSDRKGRFRFDDLESGYYKIVAKKKPFCDGVLGRIEVNQPKFGIVNYEIILSRTGSVSGFVYDAEGKAISGAETGCAEKMVKTDQNGFYRIVGLKPGVYHINARASGFVKEYIGPITVEEQKETAGTNFILSCGGSAKGKVVDFQTNKPLSQVHVSCSGPIYISGQTDSDGTFFLDGLKPGSYIVYFYRQGYEYFSMSFNVSARQIFDCGTVKLRLRNKYFYPVSRDKIFTPEEKVKLYFNAFRIHFVMIDIYEIDLFAEINRAKSADLSIGSILDSVDISEKKSVLSKKFDISYPSPLSELYDRKIIVGNFSEGVYVCTIKPEGLPQTRQWFTISDIGFVSKFCDDRNVYTVFSISRGKVLPDATVYTFDERWNLIKELKTDSRGQFSLSQSSRIVAIDGKSFAFSDINSTVTSYNDKRSVYAFTERPVYRPGQTVYFKAITRLGNGINYRVADFSECDVKIFAPDNSVVYETMIKPETTGSVYGQWDIP